ncbi:hypothetical protein D3C85_816570 [compost metagenome]
MALHTYSPKDVSITIAGLHTIDGYVDGTFVKIIKNTKPFETQVAMDGTRERLYHFDDGYNLELTLAQSSTSNNILSALHNIDIVTRAAKFILMLRDGSGQTTFFSATTWIESIPDVTFSNGMESRVWTLGCSDAALQIAGNGATSAVEDVLMTGAALLPVFKEFGLIGG